MKHLLLTVAVTLPLATLGQDAYAFEGRFHGGGRGGGFHQPRPAMQRPAAQRPAGGNLRQQQYHPQNVQRPVARNNPGVAAHQGTRQISPQNRAQARQDVRNFHEDHPNRDVNISGNNVVVNRGPGWAGGPVYVDGGHDYDWGEAIVGGLVGGAVGGLVAGAITNSTSQPTYAAPAPTYAAPPPGYVTVPADSAGSSTSSSASSARSSANTAQSAASSAQSAASSAQAAASDAQRAAASAQTSAQQAQQNANPQNTASTPPPAGATMAPGGRIAYGTRFGNIPDGCSGETVGPVAYQHCGADWLQPFMQGGTVIWMAVPPPQ